MNIIAVLLDAVAFAGMSPEEQFLAEVKRKVAELRDPNTSPEYLDALKTCKCSSCTSARLFCAHADIVGQFGEGHWSPKCPCHNCTCAKTGIERVMPHKDCPCEFCENARIFCMETGRAGLIAEMVNPDEVDEQQVNELEAALKGVPLAVIQLDSKTLLPKKRDRVQEFKNELMGTFDSGTPPNKEQTMGERIAELSKIIMASLGQPMPMLTNAIEKSLGKTSNPMLPPKSENQDAQKRQPEVSPSTQGEETMPNPSAPSNEFRNRKVVDIGGKEFPIFETKGTKIAVPEGMHKLEAAEWLYKQHQEEQKMVGVNEEIRGFPLDAAVALFKALNKHFGWTDTQSVPTWFGAIPPQLITVATGVNDSIQVPWGRINMPGIEDGYIQWSGDAKPDGTLFMSLRGEVKKKDRETIAKIVRDAKEFLAKESIYKGKAIRVKFPELDPDNGPDISNMPSFYDTSKVRPEEVVFAKPVEDQINVSLFTPIRHTEACRKNKIPLKRTVLFAGTYGVGKTLTAAVTAQEAEKYGWTFIMPESAEDLRSAVEFAKQYEPAIIFVEDIDSVVKGDRSVDMDSILNIVDGAESKGRELMIVLTTNHPDLINKAMLRPGRIDALIEVAPPDAYAAEKLIRVYARTLLKTGEDVTPASKMLAGHKPASIREIVERAKLAAIFNHGENADHITNEDLVVAINIMQPHFALMEEKKVETQPTIDSLVTAAVHKAQQNGATVVAKKSEARA